MKLLHGLEEGTHWLREGRKYGYPECCIRWFVAMTQTVGPPAVIFGHAFGVLGKGMCDPDNPNGIFDHVPCPNCMMAWIYKNPARLRHIRMSRRPKQVVQVKESPGVQGTTPACTRSEQGSSPWPGSTS